MKQVLTKDERLKIRRSIYNSEHVERCRLNDGKINFFIERCKGMSVLDLGSVDHFEGNWKSGFWLYRCLEVSSKNLMGLDYYQEGVDILREKGFNIIYSDAQDFKLDQQFDVVTAGDLIEHLPNLDGFIKSIRGSLVDGGRLILSTPNPWCWKYFLYHFCFGKLDKVNKEHVSWFCLQTLENLFSRYGFEVVSFKFSSRRLFEKIIPLPSRVKHTTLNVEFRKV